MKQLIIMALACTLLAAPMAAQDTRPAADMAGTGDYPVAAQVSTMRSFATIAEAVKQLPALPTVEQISSSQAKYIVDSTTYTPYRLAVEQTLAVHQYDQMQIQSRLTQVQQKRAQRTQATMQHYNRNVEAGLLPSQQEMMQIIMNSGLDMSKATEQQIMDVVAGSISKKWGVSKDEYLKIVTLAQQNPKRAEEYMKANHPDLYKRLYDVNHDTPTQELNDPRDGRLTEIGEELRTLMEQLNTVMGEQQGDLAEQWKNEMIKDWLASEEAKQVDEIERSIWLRVEQWQAGLELNDNGMTDINYPDWWTATRKRENKLIDSWNKRAAKAWLDKIEARHKQLQEIFNKVAALDAENEQLARQSEEDNMFYLMNKQQLNTLFFMLPELQTPYQNALRFPCVEHQPETGAIHLGKG